MTISTVMPTDVPTSRLRIAVVDSDTAVRVGLPLLLPSFAFTAPYVRCPDALADRPDADILLVASNTCEGGVPGGRYLDDLRTCVAAGYRVCTYASGRRPHFFASCLRAGASGVVLKSDPLDVLVDCLRQIGRGSVAVSSNATPPDPATDGAGTALTPRQRQVLAGRARGESFHKIARRLGISERTAHEHWSAIARHFAGFLTEHSAADLERSLGLDPGVVPLARYPR